jgi:hypothetical protein
MKEFDKPHAQELSATRWLIDSRRTAKRGSQSEPDGLSFDWEHPDLSNPARSTFFGEVHRRSERRTFRFSIDASKLAAAGRETDLDKLLDVLVARHAGLDDRPSLLRAIEWMRIISLEQTSPEIRFIKRRLAAREELLLPEIPLDILTIPPVLGVSPFVSWIRRPARDRLWAKNRIDIDALEYESAQLYIGLQQFDVLPPGPIRDEKAAAYTRQLLTHHRHTKQAGEILAGTWGEAIITLADLSIERLLKSGRRYGLL